MTEAEDTMLEYTKLILNKVSFNQDLFRKELKKAKRWLNLSELVELQRWCVINYSHNHRTIIEEVFVNAAWLNVFLTIFSSRHGWIVNKQPCYPMQKVTLLTDYTVLFYGVDRLFVNLFSGDRNSSRHEIVNIF